MSIRSKKEYIQDYVGEFERVLASNIYADPNEGYRKYINVTSFVDFFILNELSRNVDGYRLSTFLQKDKEKKLSMGPIWDFNIALGNANYCNGESVSDWAYEFNNICPGDFWLVPFWWEKLLSDPAFKSEIRNRWNELRLTTISVENIEDIIDQHYN